MKFEIPGYKILEPEYLVLDYNGTIACDGKMIGDLVPLLIRLSEEFHIRVVTADTFGSARAGLNAVPARIKIITPESQHIQKKTFVESLGADRVVAIGNGRNDRLMLRAAALGICVINEEGSGTESVLGSDILCRSTREAFELLLNPKRLIATLRS